MFCQSSFLNHQSLYIEISTVDYICNCFSNIILTKYVIIYAFYLVEIIIMPVKISLIAENTD